MGNKHDKAGDSKELGDKEIALLLANTEYSEEEIRKLHAGFLNDCPDGKLNKKKFVQVYKEFYPDGDAENYCKHAFQTFDRDKNGVIDFEEFLLCIAVRKKDLNHQLALAFKLYDFSNDGLIDQKELATMISAMYDLVGQKDRTGNQDPEKRALEIITALDVTGDNKISKQEFIAGCKLDENIRKLLAPNIDS